MQLEIKSLSKTYPNGVQALKDVSLTIGKGMFVLLGQNGASKSTLMRTVATLQEMPLRCALAPENDTFTEEIHQLIYGKSRNKYRILFTLREDTVFILHVRHTSQAPLISDIDEEGF